MLVDVLYYIFIFPLEHLLGFVLEGFYGICGSYGVSIMLLSLCVNVFLLKLTGLSEKAANAFNALKRECDNKVREFKRVFKGAELQSYIRILYRQKHFHPIFALKSLGGLALQIPFFIAMIMLVEHSAFLEGQGFLFITDLSKADSILSIESLSIESLHLLPFVMCLLTLLNVFYSSKERTQRVQGVALALIFLILLYEMPSALVLYWTCNMGFGLVKTILKSWLSSRHLDSISSSSKPSATSLLTHGAVIGGGA